MRFVRVNINIRRTTMLTIIYDMFVFCSQYIIIILRHKSDYFYTLESVQVNIMNLKKNKIQAQSYWNISLGYLLMPNWPIVHN